MKITVQTTFESGEYRDRSVGAQVLESIFHTNVLIGFATESEPMLCERIKSIDYTFEGETSKLDARAHIIVEIPPLRAGEKSKRVLTACIGEFRLGKGCPTEEFAGAILNAAAKAAGLMRSPKS